MVYAEAVNTPTESQNYPKATISAQASSKSPSTAQPQELRAPQTSVLHATRHSGCQQAETRAHLSTQPSLGARGRVFPIHFYSGNKQKKKMEWGSRECSCWGWTGRLCFQHSKPQGTKWCSGVLEIEKRKEREDLEFLPSSSSWLVEASTRLISLCA